MDPPVLVNDNFRLYQNYPNPFNPSTKIKFTLPKLRFTILKIYDVLGSEVATLVNEELSAGEYEIEFNGESLPAGRQGLTSGVYFYQLRVGEFIQSKKMLLLK
ncbi:MAG: T9SS type A sorting domain-containing protein [Ignavibacteria bacterium]|nr:T9SS type A sorting domain-containing protein [Ignavibacteria bacterium]